MKNFRQTELVRYVAYCVFLFGLAICLFVRIRTAPYGLLDIDEGSFAAAAMRTLDRSAPILQQIRDNKPPGVYVPYWISFAVFGPYSMTYVHLIGMLVVLLTGMLLVAFGMFFSNVTFGMLACGSYYLFTSLDFHHVAMKSEILVNLFLMATVVCVLSGVKSRSFFWMTLGGAFGAFGFLCKQQNAPILAAVGLCLIAYYLMNGWRRNLRQLATVCLGLTAGFVLCLSAVMLVYWRMGALYDFLLQTFMLPADLVALRQVPIWRRLFRVFTYMEDFTEMAQFLSLIAVCGIISVASSEVSRKLMFGTWGRLGAVVVVGLFAGCFTSFFSSADIFRSYFVLLLLPLSIGTAISVYLIFVQSNWSQTPEAIRLILAAGCIIAFLLGGVRSTLNPIKALFDGDAAQADSVTQAILARAQPTDLLYVWGWHPELYVTTKLHPTTRFTVATSIVGFGSSNGDETSASQPNPYHERGSWREFMRELEDERPRFFVDAKEMTYGIPAPISRFPVLLDYISRNYKQIPVDDPKGSALYLRRD